jgi:hypothetical protein
MGRIVNVYKALKKHGYQYIAAERIGGETAHKTVPVYSQKFGWLSDGWRFVVKAAEHANVVDRGYMHIDEVIAYVKEHEDDMLFQSWEGKLIYTKTCKLCGAVYRGRTVRSVYCSDGCRYAMIYIQEGLREKRSVSQMRNTTSKYKELVNFYFDRLEKNNE